MKRMHNFRLVNITSHMYSQSAKHTKKKRITQHIIHFQQGLHITYQYTYLPYRHLYSTISLYYLDLCALRGNAH